MIYNIRNKLFVLFVIILLIIGALLFLYNDLNKEDTLLVIWDTEDNVCNLAIHNFTQNTTLEYQDEGICHYSIEIVNDVQKLIRYNHSTPSIDILSLSEKEVDVEEKIVIPMEVTDVPQLSSDGLHVYFSAIVNDIEHSYVMNVQTNQIDLLFENLSWFVTQPRLSPDKNFLTVIHNPELKNRYECLILPSSSYSKIVHPECLANGDLYLINLITWKSVNLTSLTSPDLLRACNPQWSRDSKYLTVEGSCIDQGGVSLISVDNNYEVTHFPESLSGGQWLSDDYVLFSINNDDLSGFKSVAYSIKEQVYQTIPSTILPPQAVYLETDSSNCLVVNVRQTLELTINCLTSNGLEFDTYEASSDGLFYYTKWSPDSLLATYRRMKLSDEDSANASVVVFDLEGDLIYEYKMDDTRFDYPTNGNFGWLVNSR